MFGFRESLRQRRFAPEFRIAEPLSPDPRAPEPQTLVPETLEPVVEAAPPPPSDLDDETVADVATNLWRVLKRFKADAEGSDGDVPKAQRIATRNLNAVEERLKEAGVRVQDHDNLVFDPGMSLKALAYEPRAGIDREVVVETVRPSVYRGDQCIQFGHVIVGVPEKGQDDDARDH